MCIYVHLCASLKASFGTQSCSSSDSRSPASCCWAASELWLCAASWDDPKTYDICEIMWAVEICWNLLPQRPAPLLLPLLGPYQGAFPASGSVPPSRAHWAQFSGCKHWNVLKQTINNGKVWQSAAVWLSETIHWFIFIPIHSIHSTHWDASLR
jgi:hypothetical protein